MLSVTFANARRRPDAIGPPFTASRLPGFTAVNLNGTIPGSEPTSISIRQCKRSPEAEVWLLNICVLKADSTHVVSVKLGFMADELKLYVHQLWRRPGRPPRCVAVIKPRDVGVPTPTIPICRP